MPEWTKTENKPAYTASEVGAATAADITAAVNAVEIGGRNLLYDSTREHQKRLGGTTVINVGGEYPKTTLQYPEQAIPEMQDISA